MDIPYPVKYGKHDDQGEDVFVGKRAFGLFEPVAKPVLFPDEV